MGKAKWFKGNIHTNVAGGDAEPEVVVRWYRRHGYDFLVLSDHNHLTLLDYSAGKRRFKRPLMIPGEEVSLGIKGGVPVHINGIGISRVIEPVDAGGVVPTIQAIVDDILEAGGIASINHPNLRWAFDHEAIRQVTGASLLEMFNGHPSTNNYGAPDRLSHEQIWDGVLSAGRAIFGVATDDSHSYHDFSREMSNPGRGWVVRAEELGREAIVEGLASGDFYASTGVTLADLRLSQEAVHLSIEPTGDQAYATRFTGRDGVLLAESVGTEASYRARGDEGYVRATVSSSNGARAWIQPLFIQ